MKYAEPKTRIGLSDGSCDEMGVHFHAENYEGARGYHGDEDTAYFNADLYRNGELVKTDELVTCTVNFGTCIAEVEDFAEAGDTVKVVVHADPAKPDYDQEDAVLEFEVA